MRACRVCHCLSFLGRLDEPPPAKIVGQNSPDCRDELLCCLLSGTRTCLLVTLSLASWLTCDPGMAPVGPCDAGGLKVEYLNNRFECLYLVQQLRRQVAGVTIFTPAPAVLLRYLLASGRAMPASQWLLVYGGSIATAACCSKMSPASRMNRHHGLTTAPRALEARRLIVTGAGREPFLVQR